MISPVYYITAEAPSNAEGLPSKSLATAAIKHASWSRRINIAGIHGKVLRTQLTPRFRDTVPCPSRFKSPTCLKVGRRIEGFGHDQL